MVVIGVVGDNVTNQFLMRASLRERKPKEALKIFRRVMSRGAEPGGLFYSLAVQAACKTPDLVMALELLREMRENLGVPASQESYTSVIVAFVKENNMEEALKIKDEMVGFGIPMTVIAATSLITGYRKGNELVIDLSKKMVNDGIRCDLFTYTTLIDGLLKDGNLVFASDLYSELLASGIVPDEILYVVLVNGLSKKGQFVRASKMLEEMKKEDMSPNVLIYSTVIAGHQK